MFQFTISCSDDLNVVARIRENVVFVACRMKLLFFPVLTAVHVFRLCRRKRARLTFLMEFALAAMVLVNIARERVERKRQVTALNA